MPDLSCADVADAALKIQKVYRGFQSRKEIKSRKADAEDLPDLKCQDVMNATVKIQKVYRGFRTRLVLKYFSRFWEDLELSVFNCNISLYILHNHYIRYLRKLNCNQAFTHFIHAHTCFYKKLLLLHDIIQM